MNHNPYQAYKQQSVMTMTAGEMLTAVYDGLLKELTVAQAAFAAKDMTAINLHLQKAQRILHYLINSLDRQYEISGQLSALYDYFLHVVVQANIKKEDKDLDAVMTMVRELRETYIQADRKLRAAEAVG